MPAPIGVILCNIGSPSEPTPKAVRAYLQKFLSDKRIIDYPDWLWQPILQLILASRPAKVAAAYREIWTPDGSPLLIHSLAQRDGLRKRLGGSYAVELGLSYTANDIASAMRTLEASGCERILVVPLFPEFSTTTTASAYDAAVAAALGYEKGLVQTPLAKKRITPLTLLPSFSRNPRYQKALATHIKKELAYLPEPPDHLLFSFHGIPLRYEKSGDPYREECQSTVSALSNALELPEGSYTLSFQSKFGPEEWLKPSTQELFSALPKRGVRRLAVVAPGFASDCIETLEELRCEGRELWVKAGGLAANFHVLPCLNASEPFLDFLAELIEENSPKS